MSTLFLMGAFMALQTIDNDTLAESLFEIFRSCGYEGTTISQLSESTGLKKSSLYHRFPAGKDDMVKAVVAYVSGQLHQHVIEPLLDSHVSPEQRFSNMLVTIKAFYSDGQKNCLLNALTLGNGLDEIKALLVKDYKSWLAALIQLSKGAGMNQQEAEVKSEHFLIAVEGALVIQRLTNNPQTFENCMDYEQKHFFHTV
ncbi:MAG: TetR/AcrR family transcriptional regulator [Methyloglobulus sp.]|nr:TetR/AcrR family transcriptional regulator [Methyloglobulus sp.]